MLAQFAKNFLFFLFSFLICHFEAGLFLKGMSDLNLFDDWSFIRSCMNNDLNKKIKR